MIYILLGLQSKIDRLVMSLNNQFSPQKLQRSFEKIIPTNIQLGKVIKSLLNEIQPNQIEAAVIIYTNRLRNDNRYTQSQKAYLISVLENQVSKGTYDFQAKNQLFKIDLIKYYGSHIQFKK